MQKQNKTEKESGIYSCMNKDYFTSTCDTLKKKIKTNTVHRKNLA